MYIFFTSTYCSSSRHMATSNCLHKLSFRIHFNFKGSLQVIRFSNFWQTIRFYLQAWQSIGILHQGHWRAWWTTLLDWRWRIKNDGFANGSPLQVPEHLVQWFTCSCFTLLRIWDSGNKLANCCLSMEAWLNEDGPRMVTMRGRASPNKNLLRTETRQHHHGNWEVESR